MSRKVSLLILLGLAILILDIARMVVLRTRPGSEIDAVATILLAFLAYAILLFAAMVRKGKFGSTRPSRDASCTEERTSFRFSSWGCYFASTYLLAVQGRLSS